MSAQRSGPGAPTPQLAAASALIAEGRFEDAKTTLLRSIQQAGPSRGHPDAFYLLALASDALGQAEQAIHFFERAVAAAPHDARIVTARANNLGNLGRLEDGLTALQAYSATHPPNTGVAASLAKILAELNRDEEALRVVEAVYNAGARDSGLASVHGALLDKLGRPDEALAIFREGNCMMAEALLLGNIGRVAESIARFRVATEKFPDHEAGWIQYAFALNYSDTDSAEETARAHRQIGRTLRARSGPPFTSWNVDKNPDRPLRVGIISPDLRRHAVVSFLAPLLENYSKSEWHLVAYSTSRKKDDVTARLRSLVDGWCELPNPFPRYVATRIRQDRIDVLIELSGHTEGGCLPAVHIRPAPVQATYLGYPNTTGLDTINVRIVDSITDPPGSEALAVEKLSRIDPCFLCYKPIVDAPPLALPPSASGKPIAFGSFNLPKKMSPRLLALWSRVLEAVPGSTLVLKHAILTQPWMRENLSRRLVAAGIDASRITVLPPMPSYTDHLAAYAHIDIALDTFPYHGTTTTCEALWMGVPVIALTGDRHASRVGTSLLSAIGLADLSAPDEAAFVHLATTLAKDTARLRAWRTEGPSSLRSIMERSPLCNGKAFAARFQAAIREAWRAYCLAAR